MPAKFGSWTQSNYGIKTSQSARIASILGSDVWTNLWALYVSTSYGQKHFNFTTADEIANTKLDMVSNSFILLLLLLPY